MTSLGIGGLLAFAAADGEGNIVSAAAWMALALSSGLAFWFFARKGLISAAQV